MIEQRQAFSCGAGCRGCRPAALVASPALARTLNGFAGLLFAVPVLAIVLLALLLRESAPLVQGGSLLASGALWTALLRTQRQFFQGRLENLSSSEPMAPATVINPGDSLDGEFRPEQI